MHYPLAPYTTLWRRALCSLLCGDVCYSLITCTTLWQVSLATCTAHWHVSLATCTTLWPRALLYAHVRYYLAKCTWCNSLWPHALLFVDMHYSLFHRWLGFTTSRCFSFKWLVRNAEVDPHLQRGRGLRGAESAPLKSWPFGRPSRRDSSV